jgi:hypothetical protein
MVTVNSRSRAQLRSVQLGLFLAVEVGWLSALSVVLGAALGPPGSGPLVSLSIVLVVLLVATGITRLALRHFDASRRLQLGIATLGLVSAAIVAASLVVAGRGTASWNDLLARSFQTLFGFQILGAMALTVVIWWRGIATGRSRLKLDDVESGLRTASTMLALLFVLNALDPPDRAAGLSALVGAALLVLFAGLTGMPFAKIMDLGANPRNRDQPALGINRHWLGMLLGTISALLLLTIILAVLFTFERIDQLIHPLATVVDTVLGWVVYAIALPLGFLIEGLIYLFRLLIHPGQPPPPPPQPVNLLAQLRDQASQGAGPSVLLALVAKWALIGLLVLIVLRLLSRAVIRYADSLSLDDVAEERDFVWSWSGVGAAVRVWFRRFFGKRRLIAAWLRPRAVIAEETRSQTRDPRELYRQLLRLGESLGRRREMSETPAEYELGLDTIPLLAAGEPEIRILTAVYVRARYAKEPPPLAEVTAAREALDRLKALEEKSADSAPTSQRTSR